MSEPGIPIVPTRADSTIVSLPVTLPIPTQLGFPTGTVTLSDAVNWVNVHSDGIASYIGSSALQGVQGTLVVKSPASYLT